MKITYLFRKNTWKIVKIRFLGKIRRSTDFFKNSEKFVNVGSLTSIVPFYLCPTLFPNGCRLFLGGKWINHIFKIWLTFCASVTRF